MIYLVRHGEAAAKWGEADDPGLSPLGVEQATSAAEQLRGETIRQIVASPMARCQQTALPFSQQSNLPVGTDLAVTEIPTLSGLADRVTWLRSFMAGDWIDAPALLADWRTSLINRIEALPDETVVFTHFVVINAVVGHISGSSRVISFQPANASITRLGHMNGKLAVMELGCEAETRVL